MSITAKLVSKLSTNTEGKVRLQRACLTTISGVEITLKIAKEAAGDVEVPGLQRAIGDVLLSSRIPFKMRGTSRSLHSTLIASGQCFKLLKREECSPRN
jgi:hypothetical protein